MPNSIRPHLAVVLSIASTILAASPSLASPITYTEEATASGSLNGVTFTNADVVLRMTGDTANVGISPGFNLGTVTVSVGGGLPAIFVNSAGVFSTALVPPFPGQVAGVTFFEIRFHPCVSPGATCSDGDPILGTSSQAFAAYDLKTPIGPISGATSFFSGGFSFPTTDGDFILTSAGATSTFTARIVTTPEPGSLALLGAAIAGWALSRRRRTADYD
jgi:PEP-CTERM motif